MSFNLTITRPSDHSHLCSLKCRLIFFPNRPGGRGLILIRYSVEAVGIALDMYLGHSVESESLDQQKGHTSVQDVAQ